MQKISLKIIRLLFQYFFIIPALYIILCIQCVRPPIDFLDDDELLFLLDRAWATNLVCTQTIYDRPNHC